jgi:putative salt-induced outer membrane protein YdiY
MNNKLAIAALFGGLSLNAFAEEAEAPKDPLTMSAELGALFKSGDTKSTDIKAGFDADYEKGLWRSALRFDLLARKTEIEDENGEEHSETTDQQWKLVLQTNYTINTERSNYVYGNVSYDDNRFGGFESQSSVSAGWGRRWFESKTGSFDADIGPGYKSDVARSEDANGNELTERQGAFIIQAQALYIRNLNEHVEFKQLFVAKYATQSGENSNYQAESSLTTKLISTLQLKFSFKIDHNTEVEEGKENTNTQTGITLVYSF